MFFSVFHFHCASLLFPFNHFPSLLLSAVHGLSSVPQQQQQPPHLSSPSRREGVVTLPSHRPVERTRSEPPPYSHSPLTLFASHHSHTQHQLLQQYNKGRIERFKQNSHLSKVRGGTSMSHTTRTKTRTMWAVCLMWSAKSLCHLRHIKWFHVLYKYMSKAVVASLRRVNTAKPLLISANKQVHWEASSDTDPLRRHGPGGDRIRNGLGARVRVQLRTGFNLWGQLPQETEHCQHRLGLRHRVHDLLTWELDWALALH